MEGWTAGAGWRACIGMGAGTWREGRCGVGMGEVVVCRLMCLSSCWIWHEVGKICKCASPDGRDG